MGYATNTYNWSVGDDVTFEVNFVLGYISKADISVYIVGDLDAEGNQVYQEFDWVDDFTIILETAPTANCQITVQRTVSKQLLPVDFTAGGSATRQALDSAFRYLLMVYHELLDERLVDRASTAPVPTTIVETLVTTDYLQALIDEAGPE